MNDNIIDVKLPISGALELVSSMSHMGFQATELYKAVQIMETMLIEEHVRFFSFTANMVASGSRGTITWACKNGLPAAIITTLGAIDHDIAKCYGDYELGSFKCDDTELMKNGYHRIGNVLVPEKVYGAVGAHLEPIIANVIKKGQPI